MEYAKCWKLRQLKVNGYNSGLVNISVNRWMGGRQYHGGVRRKPCERKWGERELCHHNNIQMSEPGKLYYCHTTKFLGLHNSVSKLPGRWLFICCDRLLLLRNPVSEFSSLMINQILCPLVTINCAIWPHIISFMTKISFINLQRSAQWWYLTADNLTVRYQVL